MNRPIAEPSPTSDERIYKAHAEKIHFVNPPGAEHYAACHPHGSGARHQNYSEIRKRFDFGPDRLAVKGRPVK
jgi:hypothetical protein